MLTTETFNRVATIQYPVTDFRFARTTPDLLETGRDLNNAVGPNAHILVTGLPERRLASQAPNDELTHLIGTIVPVRPSRPSGQQWYLDEEDNPREGGSGAYLEGARVNPDPINDRLYLELSHDQGVPARFILRYNDEAHRVDRAQAWNPWTIVWGHGALSGAVGQYRVTAPAMWVEVSSVPGSNETPVNTGLATDLQIDEIFLDLAPAVEPVATAEVVTITNEVVGHTLGKAHVEADGSVIVNPEIVEGESYLMWYDDEVWYSDHVELTTATGGDDLTVCGYFNRGSDGSVYYNDDAWHVPVTGATKRWARLGYSVAEPLDNAEARVTELTTEAETAHEAFEDLNDALNVLARQQSWCSEYERTMEGIGMRHRRSSGRQPYDPDNITVVVNRHAWDIEVEVDLSVEVESPGYRIMNGVEYEVGGNIGSISNLRFDATMSVTINGIVADTEEEAREMIGTSEVEAEVDGHLSDGFTIDDWNITDVTEDEDFDWDDYDG